MAMLAEPRRKQRIGPNPRGKFFQEDDDNRGRQMLMKMGWNTGDGLGAERQGMSEPIKPKVNTDSRGLGFDKTTDPWVAHNEEFEQLLKKLHTEGDGTISNPKTVDEDASNSSNEGLEKKSKGSRSRIHYHKFVKNKDLSRASTKDISCIFGKVLDKTTDIYGALNSGDTDQNEPTTVENGTECDGGDMIDNLSSSPDEKSKKKKKKRDKNLTEELEEASVEEEIKIKKKRDKNLTEEPEVVSVEEEIKKKKKKKRDKNLNEEPEEVSVEEEIKIKKKRKRDRDLTEQPGEVSVEDEIKKKKKKRDKNLTEEPVEVSLEDDIKIKKKKKRDRDLTEESIEESLVNDSLIPTPDEAFVEGESKTKKKKKRSRDLTEESVEDSTVNDSQVQTPEEASVEEESKTKKKKKKRDRDITEELEETSAEGESQTEKNKLDNTTTTTGNPGDKVENFGSLTFINRGSLHDYFRNKMLSKGIKCSM